MQELGSSFVDEFMAITGADGSEAKYYLSQNQDNLEKALHDFFEDPTKAHKNIKKTNMLDAYRLFKTQAEGQNCLVRKIDVTGRSLIEDVKIFWKEIMPTVIRGTTPGEQFLIKMGGQPAHMNFLEGTFDEALKMSFDVEKPLILLVYTEVLKNRMGQILSPEIASAINQNYLILGLISTNQELSKSLKQYNPGQPSLNIFRVNFVNEVMLMSEYDVKPHTQPTEILSFLRRTLESIREEEGLQRDVKRQVLDQLNPVHDLEDDDRDQDSHYPIYDDIDHNVSDYQAERQIKQKQEQEFMEMVHQHQRKKSQKLEFIQKEKQQKEKLQQMQQDRKVRKMSLPEEPNVGQIITISFRLPMGGRLLRSFNKSQRIDLIYNFIELEEKVQLENQMDRKFDLLTLTPSQSLANKRRLTIEQVFGDQTQEVLVVKQL